MNERDAQEQEPVTSLSPAGAAPGLSASGAQATEAAQEQEPVTSYADIVIFCHPRNVGNLVRSFEDEMQHAAGELPVRDFSSTLLLSYNDQPLVAVVYELVTDTLYLAEREAGAWLNGERMRVSHTPEFRQCRTFLIPDFVTKREALTARFRQELYQRCRRVLDTWSPALDWCLVASGRADLVVTLAGAPLTPDAGTLILEEAGGRITDFSGQRFDGRAQRCLIGSNGTDLHDQLLQCIQSWQRSC